MSSLSGDSFRNSRDICSNSVLWSSECFCLGATSTIYDPNTEGAWITSSNPKIYKKYEYLYYDNFKKVPNRITSIVYDMVWSVIDLTYDNGDLELEDFVLEKSGFEAIDCSFRFLENGIVKRNFLF